MNGQRKQKIENNSLSCIFTHGDIISNTMTVIELAALRDVSATVKLVYFGDTDVLHERRNF